MSFAPLSCGTKDYSHFQSKYTFHLEEFDDLSYSDLVIESTTPLETNNSNLMGMDLRIKFFDSLIFVMDEGTKDGIHIFDHKGGFVGTTAKVGEGPDQIVSLSDFFIVDSNHIEVLSTVGSSSSIYDFSIQNNKSKIAEIEYVATSMTKLENGNYLLYGSYNLPAVKNRIVITKPSGSIEGEFLENKYKNKMLPMTERNFFESDGSIFVVESFNNRIYKFESDSLNTHMEADFGLYSLPREFWTMDIMDSFQMINERGFANFRSIFRGNDFYVTDIMVQKGSDVSKYVLILFRDGEKKFKLKSDLEEQLLYYYPIGIDNEDRLLFLTYHSILKNYWRELPNSTISKELPTKEFDYPVILKTKLKY